MSERQFHNANVVYLGGQGVQLLNFICQKCEMQIFATRDSRYEWIWVCHIFEAGARLSILQLQLSWAGSRQSSVERAEGFRPSCQSEWYSQHSSLNLEGTVSSEQHCRVPDIYVMSLLVLQSQSGVWTEYAAPVLGQHPVVIIGSCRSYQSLEKYASYWAPIW